jgi:hypothetical protein
LFLGKLFNDILGGFFVLTFLCVMVCGAGVYVLVADFAVAVWLTFSAAFAAGYGIGFLAQLFCVVDETWMGENKAVGRSDIRRAS